MKTLGNILIHLALSLVAIYILGFAVGLRLMWTGAFSENLNQVYLGLGLIIGGLAPTAAIAWLGFKFNPDASS